MTKREKAAIVICLCAAAMSIFIMLNQIRITAETEKILHAYTQTTAASGEEWFGEAEAIGTQAPETTAMLVEGHMYVLNESSKKIHTPECRYAQSIGDENSAQLVTDSIDALLENGYSRCSVCGAE